MAINRDAAGRPRWEERGVTDRNTGLTGSTGSRRWRQRLVVLTGSTGSRRWRQRLIGWDDGATTMASGGTQNRWQVGTEQAPRQAGRDGGEPDGWAIGGVDDPTESNRAATTSQKGGQAGQRLGSNAVVALDVDDSDDADTEQGERDRGADGTPS
ncbi:hypothetical protein E2562_019705, partial [Oryza meyeriana var. granulata]